MTVTPRLGRLLSAMVTPMKQDGSLDLEAAAALATHLVDAGHDGLVVSGTTGESPTTSATEKDQLLRAVVEAVGDRAVIIAGAGSNDTAKSVESAKAAAAAGADALLTVTPYYNKPPQAGLVQHFRAVADSTDLPVMIYDIPGRSVIPVAKETFLAIADHPNIVAVKDARADLWLATEIMMNTDLEWYCGDDALTLHHAANGAVGLVGVTSQVFPQQYRALVDAAIDGDLAAARQHHRDLVPAVNTIMNLTQGAIMAKAALARQGVIPTATVRLPLVEPNDAENAALDALLGTAASGAA